MSKHKINGKNWDVRFTNVGLCEEYYGYCIYDKRIILIDPKEKKKRIVNTIIHEAIHAACQQLTEEAVTEAANVATEILFKNKKRISI